MNTSLGDLIAREAVRPHLEVANWEEAVQVVGDLLVDRGSAEPSYVAAMKQAVIDLGPYMVVAPGVAIPHARPEAGVKEPGLAVATLTTPVDFGHKKNDPVRIVIGFAAVNKEAHLETIQKIVGLLQDDERMTKVHAATTQDELFDALNA